jgi:MazG family protein
VPRRKSKSTRNSNRKKPAEKVTAAAKSGRTREDRAKITVSAGDRSAGTWFAKLVALQKRLYGPGGCPWDREQTHESLRKYLIEETYETLDAMESDDPRKFTGELGDLLLQVVFHSVLAEEAGKFTVSDVIESIHSKMVRRHPHVFGNVDASDSAAVLKNWEQFKAQERTAEKEMGPAGANGKDAAKSGTDSIADSIADSIIGGVPRSLPAVLEAYQYGRRASHVGFDWLNLQELLEKLDEEMLELRETTPSATSEGPSRAKATPRTEEEAGDLLFTAVNVARFLGVDPEIALKKANAKFRKRFQWMEAAAEREGVRFADLPRARMEALWNSAKGAL